MPENEGEEPSSLADAAALTAHFEALRSRLLAMLRRRIDPVLAPRLDAEDLLNEVYLIARRRWGRFPSTGLTPYAWFYRLALDTLFEAWRRENRAGRNPDREMPWPDRSSVQLGMGMLETDTSPSACLARDELRDLVRRAIDSLKPEDREILGMRHFDEISFREAAMILGITENTAMQRYVRALRRFKYAWLKINTPEDGQ
jgi:RNA polymerase sigma-70 factor (ECF subfamily)